MSKPETTVDALLPYYERMTPVVWLILWAYQEYRVNGSNEETLNLVSHEVLNFCHSEFISARR